MEQFSGVLGRQADDSLAHQVVYEFLTVADLHGLQVGKRLIDFRCAYPQYIGKGFRADRLVEDGEYLCKAERGGCKSRKPLVDEQDQALGQAAALRQLSLRASGHELVLQDFDDELRVSSGQKPQAGTELGSRADLKAVEQRQYIGRLQRLKLQVSD